MLINKQSWKEYNHHLYLVVTLLTLTSASKAAFDIRTDNWPARTKEIEKAPQPSTISTPSPNEKNIKYDLIADQNRFTARLGPGLTSQTIHRWNTQKSSRTLNSITDISRDTPSFEAAVGYKFIKLRGELELVLNKKYYYSVTLLNFGQLNMQNSIATQSLLINGFYDFDRILYFKPYIGASLGLGITSSKMQFTGSLIDNGIEDQQRHLIAPVFGFNLGARNRFFERFMLQVNAKLIKNGKLKLKSANGTANITAKHKYSSFGISVVYII